LQQLAIAVDIGHLETSTFHEAQAAGVDGGEAHAIRGDAHGREDPPDLLTAQDDRELLLTPGASDVEHRPLTAERLLIEELDAAQGNGMRSASDLLDGTQVQQVVADVLFRKGVWGRMIELRQLRDGVDVSLDRAIGVAAQLEILDHAVAERCHGVLPGKSGKAPFDIAPSPSTTSTALHGLFSYPPKAD
jgi:hypothetical protein